MNLHFHDTIKRKRRRHPTEMLGKNIVQLNPSFHDCGRNPYLDLASASSKSNSSYFSSLKSSSSSSFDSTLPYHSAIDSSEEILKQAIPRSFELMGFVQEDRDPNLYLPFSVNLPPLIRSPKVKKHNVVHLLEPDIGIISKTSYNTYPNPYSPSSSIPSTTIHQIPSLLLSMNEHERRERVILRSFNRQSRENIDPPLINFLTTLTPTTHHAPEVVNQK